MTVLLINPPSENEIIDTIIRLLLKKNEDTIHRLDYYI